MTRPAVPDPFTARRIVQQQRPDAAYVCWGPTSPTRASPTTPPLSPPLLSRNPSIAVTIDTMSEWTALSGRPGRLMIGNGSDIAQCYMAYGSNDDMRVTVSSGMDFNKERPSISSMLDAHSVEYREAGY